MVEESVFRRAASDELRAAIARRRMTQRQIALLTGLSLATVNRHSQGQTPMSAHQERLYADALKMVWKTNPVTGLPCLDSNQEPFDLPTGAKSAPEASLAGVA